MVVKFLLCYTMSPPHIIMSPVHSGLFWDLHRLVCLCLSSPCSVNRTGFKISLILSRNTDSYHMPSLSKGHCLFFLVSFSMWNFEICNLIIKTFLLDFDIMTGRLNLFVQGHYQPFIVQILLPFQYFKVFFFSQKVLVRFLLSWILLKVPFQTACVRTLPLLQLFSSNALKSLSKYVRTRVLTSLSYLKFPYITPGFISVTSIFIVHLWNVQHVNVYKYSSMYKIMSW